MQMIIFLILIFVIFLKAIKWQVEILKANQKKCLIADSVIQ